MPQPFTSMAHPLSIDEGLLVCAREDDYAEHVEQLIHQVLFTMPGERFNRPDFGCGIRQMIFAPNSEMAASMAQITIFQALDQWLSSVIQVEKIEVKTEEEKLKIRVVYLLKVRQEKRFLDVEIV